ncbi:MAG: DedA family protein [Deltaproteobacteria bacterium]|nr:DedA family protein [Deltaproteobacteria bacterium]
MVDAPAMRVMRHLYDWVLSWADRRGARRALVGIAIAEASVLPVPPDPLLMALTFGRPGRAMQFALLCTIGSVLGGVIGYYLGFALQDVMTVILRVIVDGLSGSGTFLGTPDAGPVMMPDQTPIFFGSHQVYRNAVLWKVTSMYHDNAFLAVLGAALTPIPYKIFTIAAGYCEISMPTFLLASVIGRGGRFFAVALLIRSFGGRIRALIDRYFNLCMLLFFALLIGGFILIRWM